MKRKVLALMMAVDGDRQRNLRTKQRVRTNLIEQLIANITVLQ